MAHESAEKSEAAGNDNDAIAHARPAPLPDEVQRCVAVIQRLEACRQHPSYGAERQRAMQVLGVSERSLRRLQQQYRDLGVEGLKRQSRADEGQSKVDDTWHEFIRETYRKGNRGTRQMSRAQVAKLVESHAAERGTPKLSQPPHGLSHPVPRHRATRAETEKTLHWLVGQSTPSDPQSRY